MFVCHLIPVFLCKVYFLLIEIWLKTEKWNCNEIAINIHSCTLQQGANCFRLFSSNSMHTNKNNTIILLWRYCKKTKSLHKKYKNKSLDFMQHFNNELAMIMHTACTLWCVLWKLYSATTYLLSSQSTLPAVTHTGYSFTCLQHAVHAIWYTSLPSTYRCHHYKYPNCYPVLLSTALHSILQYFGFVMSPG